MQPLLYLGLVVTLVGIVGLSVWSGTKEGVDALQKALPIIEALYRLERDLSIDYDRGGLLGSGGVWMPDYTAGLYTGTSYRMLVSRGLGGGMQLPRLFNNPQVVSVTLRAA